MRVSRRRAAAVLALVCALPAGSGCSSDPPAWRRLDSGLALRRVSGDPAAGEPASLTLVRVPAGDGLRLRVRHRAEGLRVADLAAQPQALAAINANFFDERGRPLGWVVADGTEHSPIGRSGWGVLSVAAGSGARIRRPAAVGPEEKPRQALQAGPLLVEGGRANPGLKAQSARRVFAGLDAEGRLVLGSTGVHPAEATALAALLARPESKGGAGLRDAINLDGGSSAQLWVRGGGEEGDLLEPGFARVPVLLVVERPTEP